MLGVTVPSLKGAMAARCPSSDSPLPDLWCLQGTALSPHPQPEPAQRLQPPPPSFFALCSLSPGAVLGGRGEGFVGFVAFFYFC